MERLIEKNRTYRIPKENGETDLYHVLETGSSLKVKDLKTNKIKNIDKQNFQTRLDQGEIYVSAKQHNTKAVLLKVLTKLIDKN